MGTIMLDDSPTGIHTPQTRPAPFLAYLYVRIAGVVKTGLIVKVKR